MAVGIGRLFLISSLCSKRGCTLPHDARNTSTSSTTIVLAADYVRDNAPRRLSNLMNSTYPNGRKRNVWLVCAAYITAPTLPFSMARIQSNTDSIYIKRTTKNEASPPKGLTP